LASWESSTTFLIYGDGVLLASNTVANDTEQKISLNVAGVRTLSIKTTNATETQPIIFSPMLMCPSNGLAVLTSTATFSVDASGTEPLSYQWFFDGVELADATNATLVLSASSSKAGNYFVVVTNSYGCATSAPVALTVFQTGALKPAVLPGGQFRFSFATANGLNYAVECSTNLTDWSPLETVGGMGLPLTLTVPSAKGQPWRFYRTVLSP
jgi:Immunoglobulin domain